MRIAIVFACFAYMFGGIHTQLPFGAIITLMLLVGISAVADIREALKK